MKNKLAIVIPYYKIDFFEETLKSIASQSDKHFTLYIGNDASPNDPLPLIKQYFEEEDYHYFDYENNLGGQNALILKENNELIGQCGLLVREVENEFELEVAYSILPKYRMQGFAIESAKKCRDFAFENNFNDRLVSIIISENKDSKNVALKNGMNFNRKIQYNNKEMELFQISENEWKSRNLA